LALLDTFFRKKKLSNVPIKDIFKGQTAIEDIEIDKRAFERAAIDTLALPESVTAIPEECFRKAKIKTLTLPSQFETIGANAFRGSSIDTLYIKDVKQFQKDSFKDFTGMIFTDNKTSKQKFLDAGLQLTQVVNLESRKERFKALIGKTFTEIRQLEKDLGLNLWDQDYLTKLELGVHIKGRNAPIVSFDDMTLENAAMLKLKVIEASKASNHTTMFNQPSSEIAKTQPESSSNKKTP